MDERGEDAALVAAVRAGDDAAFTELFRRWTDRCFDVARRILHDDGAAAEVAQDVLLVAWRQLDDLRDPAAFGGWVLRMARNRALNRLEKERRSRPVDASDPLLAWQQAAGAVEDDVMAGEHQEMVWAAAATLGERDASVLDLHLRHGLGAAEIAEELGIADNAAHQLLFRLRKRLGAAVRAWVLVGRAGPACAGLRAAMAAEGLAAYGREAVTVAERHATACADCTGRQRSVLAPDALFAAAPLLVLAGPARQAIIGALREAGVPLGPGAATASPAAVPSGDAAPNGPSGSAADHRGPDGSDAGGPSPEGTDPADPASGSGSTPDAADRPGGLDDPVAVAALGAAVEDVRRGGPVADAVAGPDEVDGDLAAERARRRALVLLALAVLVVLAGVGTWLVGRDGSPGSVEQVASNGSTEPRSGQSTTAAPSDDDEAGPSTTVASTSSSTPTTAAGTPSTFGTVPTESVPPSTVGEAPPVTVAPTSPAFQTTVPPPAAEVPPTTVPPSPRIDVFTATPAGAPDGACPPGRWATTFLWGTTHATSTAITATGEPALTGLAPDGSRIVCRTTNLPPPGGWKLSATGPGGVASMSA